MVRYRAGGLDFGGNVRIRGNLAAIDIAVTDITDPDGNVILSNDGVGNIDQLARIDDDIQLGTDRELQDASGGALIAGDNLGNIDQIGRVDAALTAPITSDYALSSIGPLVSPVQSGTINENVGSWETNGADDILYVFLGPLLSRLGINAGIRIDSVKVYYFTGHNDAYVDYARLYRNSLASVSTSMIGERDANDGDGATVQATLTVPVDSTVVANYDYFLEIKAEATAGLVKIYGVEVAYHRI